MSEKNKILSQSEIDHLLDMMDPTDGDMRDALLEGDEALNFSLLPTEKELEGKLAPELVKLYIKECRGHLGSKNFLQKEISRLQRRIEIQKEMVDALAEKVINLKEKIRRN